MKRVLVIAAHPDDEVLGAGGTLLRHRAAGDTVQVAFLADGTGARGDDPAARERRMIAARAAADVLGVELVHQGSFPDNAFDTVPLLQLAQTIEALKRTHQPDIIYTHHGGDLNVDHRCTAQAVLTAFRPQPHECYTALYAFEVNSSTEWSHPSVTPPFVPDAYVDISAHVEALLRAYACYAEETREDPHTRSIEALRTMVEHRGRQVGLRAAEAFVTLRHIWREA